MTSPTLPPFTPERLARFESFVAGLRPVFHRADQFLRFRAYLRGLLEPTPRKNVEGIAAAAAGVMTVESDLAQALQHFVSHSPWDANRLLAAVRRTTADRRADPASAWVVHDGVFPKKGRHSVGVQRQFARSAGKKLNCQVAVVVGHHGPAGYLPLLARLYLPSHWLTEYAAVVEKSVPAEFRKPVSKVVIALQLVDALREAGEPPRPVLADDGFRTNPVFSEGLTSRSVEVSARASALPDALARFDQLRESLGLDHFEGRTWAGWHHHVALVFTAWHYLAGE